MVKQEKWQGEAPCRENALLMLPLKRAERQRIWIVDEVAPEDAPPLSTIPRRLHDLFFRPRIFFAWLLHYTAMPWLYLVAWCVGAAKAIDRLNGSGLRGELDSPLLSGPYILWHILAPLTHSWLGYWLVVCISGVVIAALTWW